MTSAATAAPFLTLARDGNSAAIRGAVAAGAPVAQVNAMGQQALHIAALWGQVDAMRTLLELGADANAANARGATPLHFAAAAKKEAEAACLVLLEAGADPDTIDMMGMQPYECADDPQVRALLGGPDPRLFEYAAKGQALQLRELLASGAVRSVRVFDREGVHPLNLAIAARSIDSVKVMLAVDPQLVQLPDMGGNTPLHAAAAAGGGPELLRLLLALRLTVAELSLDAQNLHRSEYTSGNWLEKGGEEVTPLDKTPLHIAVEEGDAQAAELLLEAGARTDILDVDGRAVLHSAVEVQDEDMTALLLKHGADSNQPNRDFTSVLHLTAQSGRVTLLQLLLAHQADPATADPKSGMTPLMLAARAGNADKVQMLLQAGAPVMATNAQGNTALHLAAVNGHAQVCQVLLDAGAGPSLKTANAQCQIPAAMAKGEDLQRLLLIQATAGTEWECRACS